MSNSNMVKTIEIKNKQGQVIGTKDVVCYPALLDRAHQEGLKRIATRLLQVPTAENQLSAVILAEVETGKGVFTGIGDANPENVDSMIVPHIIRMAETRAKARALRDAVNIGVVAIEELGMEFNHLDILEGKSKETTSASKARNRKSNQAKNRKSKTSEASQAAEKKQTTTASKDRPDTQRPAEDRTDAYLKDDLMTEPQRRYLFRLLSDQGVTGDEAHDYLIDRFKVQSLKEVTKAQAHELIDALLTETEEVAV